MSEAVGPAASVITVINLSVEVANLCFQYSTAAGNAGDSIKCLQRELKSLCACLERAQHLFNDSKQHAYEKSQALVDCLEDCASELAQVQNRLNPSEARKAMPLDGDEVDKIVSNLQHYKKAIVQLQCLQIDQAVILLDMQQSLEGITIQPGRDGQVARSPCFSVPFDRDPDFVDRPDITTWLEGKYKGSAGRMALVGMGGFGKSQVAIQFAHHIHEESPQTSVYWVHASSKLRFEGDYRLIAEKLELPRWNDPDIDVCELVRDWLQTEESGPWLVVLDNADDVDLFYPADISGHKATTEKMNENAVAGSNQRPLATYLPRHGGGTILITSRSMEATEKLTGNQDDIYRVSAMHEAQGLQLFQNKLNRDFEKNAAADLLRALNFIPLAINQAAAYINHSPRTSIKTYLDTFRESDRKSCSLLNCNAGDLRESQIIPNSVVTTWQVTFEHISCERPSAARLLSFMSFFDAQRIPKFVLRHHDTNLVDHANRDTESDSLEGDLDLLHKYSLVYMAETRNICEMHTLVQFCTQAWITWTDNAEQWRHSFLRSMGRHFPDGSFETRPTCQMLLPHVESLLNMEPPGKDLESWVYLLTNCARYFLRIGNYKAAEDLDRKAVEARTKVLRDEYPDTLLSMRNQASRYVDQGRWKEAERLHIQAMEAQKGALKDEYPNTLDSMADPASTYMHHGRRKGAEKLKAPLMKRRNTMRGDEHPDTLLSLENLAFEYSAQGRWEEAEEFQVRLMEAQKKVLGDEHPSTLSSMHDLARIYLRLGRSDEAEKLNIRVVEERRRVLGDRDIHTWSSMIALSSIYSGHGRLNEAEELDVQLLKLTKRFAGKKNRSTLTVMFKLATTWKALGRTEDALALMRKCLVLQQQVIGRENPETISSAALLADWENMEAFHRRK